MTGMRKITKRTFLIALILVYLTLNSNLLVKSYGFTMSNDSTTLQGIVGYPDKSDFKNNKPISTKNAFSALNHNSNSNISSGFKTAKGNSQILISISSNLIDFGQLSATNPVTRASELEIYDSEGLFQVYSYENSPLRTSKQFTIPDTICDSNACDEQNSGQWTNTLTYGFGYRCDDLSSINCVTGFDSGYYKQFADILSKKEPIPIIEGSASQKNQSTQITYKVNISGTQQSGSYFNTITYFLVPSY